MFSVYLPIAQLSVNGLAMLGLGAAVGYLAGMFGIGGGFRHMGRRMRAEQLRALLAVMVLGVAVRLLFGLFSEPAEPYSISTTMEAQR